VANFSVNPTCTGYQTNFTNVSTPTISITSYTWNYGDGTTNITTSFSNTTHNYTNQGTYTVSLNVTTAYCSDSITISLLVSPTPMVNYTASTYTVCPNTAISFSNTSTGAITYSWTFGSLGISDSTNPVQIYTNGTQTVTTYPTKLVAISTQGCKDSITQGIAVNPAPVAQYITSYAPSCAPVLITFTNTTIGGNTYLWSFGDGTSYNHFDTTHLYADTTTTVKTFSVSMITVNTYSCSDTSYSSYVVYPEAIYNFSPTINSGCAPLLATFHTDSGAVSYLWSFGDGSLSAGSYIQTHTFINVSTVNDTFNVILYSTNAYNCRDTAYGTVIVKPSPNSQFTPSPTSGCTPLAVSFSNTSTGGISNQWYFGDSTTSTVVVPTHTYINTGSTVINVPVSLVVTSANHCTDSTTTDITLYPAANYSFTVSKDTGCSVFDELFTTDTTSTILASYAWHFGDGTSLTGNNPTHNYSTDSLSGQTFTVTMTAISQYGCVNTQTSTVFVYPKPTASFTLSNTIGCAPLVTTFSNTSIGALSGTWYFGDSPTDTSNLISLLTHTYQNVGVAAQSYYASLVIKGAHGCKDSTSQVIIANPTPLFSYQILPDSGCSPLPVNFVLTPTNFSPGSVTYIWHFGDSATSSLANPSHTYINATNTTETNTVSLTATNSNGCSNIVDSTVTVFSVPATSFVAGPLVQTYPNATVSFINTSQAGLTYNWNLGDSTQLTTYAISPHMYATWGTYPIKLIVNNGHCRDSVIQNITINPPIPIAKFTGGGIGCQPLPVTFTNTSVYATNYLWNFGDSNYVIQANPTHTYNNPGVFTVTLIASGTGGADTLIQSSIVTVYQKPFAYFTASPLLVYIPNEAVYFTNQPQSGANYLWNFGDGGSSTETNPQHTYYIGGDYSVTLIATSAYGCTDTFTLGSTIKALVSSSVQVPNAFTPNPNGPSGGGVYDPTALNNWIFHPVLTGIVQYNLTIYNKWGELLFETTNQAVGWDGYFNDKLCQEDTYIYKIYAISVTSDIIQKTGNVALFR
jgi:gliding motility-associated-like protein